MTNMQRIEELKKMDYNLQIYIQKHTKVLNTYGHNEEEIAEIIVNKIRSIIDKV
jgi:uncharacterized membrane-anchored protein